MSESNLPSKKNYSPIGEFLRKLDHFSVTFNFRVDKKPKYGSITGGIFFIIFLIFAIGFTILRIFDYLSWADSKIQFIEKSINPSPALNMKNLNFSYAVKVTFDNDTNVKDSSLADLFEMEHSYVFKNSTFTNKTKGISHQCKDADFYNRSSDYPVFKKDSIENFDCFDIGNDFILQGIYTDSSLTYLEILLKITNKYFKDYENLKNIFQKESFKFTFYYIDTFNDVSNFLNPVFYKIDALYTYLDLNYYKRNNVNFQQFVYSSDKNLFYNNYISNKFMKLYSNQEILTPVYDRQKSVSNENTYLNKFILRAVNNEKIVKLSFVKIPEFLASLSGLLVNLLVILSIILTALNFFEAKQTIMSKIMKYKDFIRKNDKSSLDYLEKRFKNNYNNPPNMYTHNSTNNNINKDYLLNINRSPQSIENIYPLINDKNVITEKAFDSVYRTSERISEEKKDFIDRSRSCSRKHSDRTEDNPLNQSLYTEISNVKEIKNNKNPYLLKASDICKMIFCCKCFSRSYKKKMNIFSNAEKKFNFNLDLVTYMKKMQEIEILKYLILDKDTIHLMNFISKPSVCLTNYKTKDEEYQLFFENLKKTNSLDNQNVDKIKSAFDNLIAKPNLTVVEKRILKLFKLQIEELLN